MPKDRKNAPPSGPRRGLSAELYRWSADTPDQSNGVLEEFPEHAALIAAIVAEWSMIEHKLIDLLTFVACDDQGMIRAVLAFVDSSSAKIEAVQAGINMVPAEAAWRKRVDELIEDSKKRLRQRNRYAHAVYGRLSVPDGDPSDPVITGGWRGPQIRIRVSDLKIELGLMKDLSHRVTDAIGDVIPWFVAHVAPTPISPAEAAADVARRTLRVRASGPDDAGPTGE